MESVICLQHLPKDAHPFVQRAGKPRIPVAVASAAT
jgi:hypothetical protein